jgi:carbohydrate-selective porin OprB
VPRRMNRVIRGCRRTGAQISVAALMLLLAASAAPGQEWWTSTHNGIPEPSLATSLPHNGDPGGYRKRLADRGVVYGLEYTNDVLSICAAGCAPARSTRASCRES